MPYELEMVHLLGQNKSKNKINNNNRRTRKRKKSNKKEKNYDKVLNSLIQC